MVRLVSTASWSPGSQVMKVLSGAKFVSYRESCIYPCDRYYDKMEIVSGPENVGWGGKRVEKW